jgi:hypothetical protein
LTFFPFGSVTAQTESKEARDQSKILKVREYPNLGADPSNKKYLDIEGGEAN